MTQIHLDQLEPVLALRTSTLLEDPDKRQEVLARIEEVDARGTKVEKVGNTTTYSSQDELIGGFLSRTGRVLGYSWSDGTRVLYEGEIELEFEEPWTQACGWHPIGVPRLYLSTASDDHQQWDDGKRLFLRHSFATGAEELFAGWKERFVTIIPEEVGMKETKVFRSTHDGTIEVEHRYAAPDAMMLYSRWLMALADEFSDSDMAGHTLEAGMYSGVAQQWLAREGANAQLASTRAWLKMLLASLTLQAQASGEEFNVSELARSLHTDRANLAKMSKPTGKVAEVSKHIEADNWKAAVQAMKAIR
jgi:hypothetical protein